MQHLIDKWREYGFALESVGSGDTERCYQLEECANELEQTLREQKQPCESCNHFSAKVDSLEYEIEEKDKLLAEAAAELQVYQDEDSAVIELMEDAKLGIYYVDHDFMCKLNNIYTKEKSND